LKNIGAANRAPATDASIDAPVEAAVAEEEKKEEVVAVAPVTIYSRI
jgi:hypothetical protein